MVNPPIEREFISYPRYGSLYVYIFLFLLFSSSAYSQSFFGYTVNSVDHKTNTLIVDDVTHTMTIGFKVYIYESDKRKKYLVNRYALKANQKIYYRSEVRNRNSYLTEVTILK